MKVLVTGGAGYVGSVITNLLLQEGFEVRAVDILWFNKTIPLVHFTNPNYEFIRGDLTDFSKMDEYIDGVDYVIHTAAVVGDPASKKFPEITKKLNEETSIELINRCTEKKVKGLFFFSTCSNYGISDGLATEDSPLNPLSLYAETKVNVERYLLEKNPGLDFVIGRLSTVYGCSQRMRWDLTVNEFALKGFRDKYIDIFLPESYRPYIHVFDLASTVVKVLRNFDKVKNNVFNIGFVGENYQKIKIAEAVKKYIPEYEIDIVKEGGDKRDYQVDFSKIHSFLDIEKIFDVEKSVKNILQMLQTGLVSDYDNPMYYNTEPDIKQ